MSWFEHKHYWASKDAHPIISQTGGKVGALIFQQCRCGAVRTVEYGSGQVPVIRTAVTDNGGGS